MEGRKREMGEREVTRYEREGETEEGLPGI